MPTLPEYVDRELQLIAGAHIFGGNNLRIVWGADQRDHNGRHKYLHPDTGRPLECWVLERWMPPGFFGTKEAWEIGRTFQDDVHGVTVDLKGDFPTRGAYVMLRPIVDKSTGGFLPLDRQVIDAIRRSVREDEAFASMSVTARDALVASHQQSRDARDERERERAIEFNREYHLQNWDVIDRSVTRGYSITPR